MSKYEPDSWVIVEIPVSNGGVFYKILGGWTGGYLEGSSWRLNSGIDRIEVAKSTDEVPIYNFYGHSGSCYKLDWYRYGLRMSTASTAQRLIALGCRVLTESEADDYIKKYLKNH